jgi:hypothetical protein
MHINCFLLQLSGQPSVLYFANRIFEQAGMGFEAALVIGVFKLGMTFASAFLVENPNFGRRSLLLYGNTGKCPLILFEMIIPCGFRE